MNNMQYTKLKIGLSVHGKEITAHTNNASAENYIYLIAGAYGDEPEGVFILNKLFSWLQLQNLSKPIMVIPIVKPDGLALNTLVNGNAIDLNRNWPSYSWSAECGVTL